MYDPHARQSVVTQWTVDARDPVVREPASEHARVVEPKHVDVRPMHEVVGEYARVAAEVTRADDADVGWRVLEQAADECFGPAGRQHVGVVVDAEVVFGVVQIRLHHGVVLRPCRLAHVGTLDEVQRHDQAGRAEFTSDFVESLLEDIEGGLLLKVCVVLVERQIEVILISSAGCPTERRQKRAQKRELILGVLVRERF